MMHAKFCVKRTNGVGVVKNTQKDRHTDTHRQTDRMKIHAPLSPLGPFTVVNYSVGIKPYIMKLVLLTQPTL